MKNLKLYLENIKKYLKRGTAITLLTVQTITMAACSNKKADTTVTPVTQASNDVKVNPTSAPTPTEAPKEEVKSVEKTEEVKPTEVENNEFKDILEEIKEERNAQFVSFEDYEKAYVEFYSKYKDILNINSIDAIVYYMNYGSLKDETKEEVVGKYITNNSNDIINDMAIALNDMVNYDLNVYMPYALGMENTTEQSTIKLSDAISNPGQKATMQYIESLVEIIAKGSKEEALEAYKQLHSMAVYQDADLENELTTEKYDSIGFNEMTPGQQYLIKVSECVKASVIAGIRGINEKTYFYDEKSNSVITSTIQDDITKLSANASNPVYGECNEIVKK